MGVRVSYSDLEVVPSSDPEHYERYYQGIEHDTRKPNPTQAHLDTHKEACSDSLPHRRRICGLAPQKFWIIAVVGLVIVIGAAVGGGIAGSQASKNEGGTGSSSTSGASVQPSSTNVATLGGGSSSSLAKSSAVASTTPQSSDSTTPTPTSTTALTTTEVIGPSYTLLRDCPSSNNTLFGITLGSNNMNFRKVCGKSYLNTLQKPGQNGGEVVNAQATSLDSCINMCASYNKQNASDIATGLNDVCNAVCWRNGIGEDNFPGQCFGYTTQNSSNAFVINDEEHCDSAAWIDQKLI